MKSVGTAGPFARDSPFTINGDRSRCYVTQRPARLRGRDLTTANAAPREVKGFEKARSAARLSESRVGLTPTRRKSGLRRANSHVHVSTIPCRRPNRCQHQAARATRLVTFSSTAAMPIRPPATWWTVADKKISGPEDEKSRKCIAKSLEIVFQAVCPSERRPVRRRPRRRR